MERVPLPDLLRAAAHGDREEVASAIGAGTSLEATDEIGWTALIAASAGGHREIVDALLRAGAHVNHASLDGWSALAAAAFGGHAEVAELLLAAGAQREVPPGPFHPTPIAAERGHRMVLRALVSRGATLRDIDRARYLRARMLAEGYQVRLGVHEVVGGYNYSPFGDDQDEPSPEVQYVDRRMTLPDADAMFAMLPRIDGATVLEIGNVEFRVFADAFKAGAKTPDGTSVLDAWSGAVLLTPRLAPHVHGLGIVPEKERLALLNEAAKAGHLSIVRCLVHDTNPDSHTIGWAASHGRLDVVRFLAEIVGDLDDALCTAARSGKLDVVRFLLDAGARVDSASGSALLDATYSAHVDVIELLLARGANPDAVGPYGSTPLLVLAEKGNAEAIRMLAGAKATVDRANVRDGATPLMHAAHYEHVECVRALLDAGATIDQQDHEGRTALMRTVSRQDYPNKRGAAALLLDRGASIDLQDKRGWTALMHAIRAPSVAMVELLVERGAEVTLRDAEGRSTEEHARKSVYAKECLAVLARAKSR